MIASMSTLRGPNARVANNGLRDAQNVCALTKVSTVLMYRSNRSFNMPPAPGIPRAFDTFAVPGRREFDYQSLPGGGEFDPHALRVGNLNCTLDFM